MFIGPVFTREAATAPRRARHFVARATYVGALLLLISTAWLVLAGTQVIRGVGDLATFAGILFQILAPLQLALATFFSALFSAVSVSQEKDRHTLILLLMTDLKNHELVLGKLLASLLFVLVLLAVALPLFMGLLLLGGVEVAQLVRIFLVTLTTALAAGSLGSTLALWREKTFQTLALTALVLVFYLSAWEGVARLGETTSVAGLTGSRAAAIFSPWRAILEATRPIIRPADAPLGGSRLMVSAGPDDPVPWYLLVASSAAVGLCLIAIVRVRVWNPSREARPAPEAQEQEGVEPIAPASTASAAAVPTTARHAPPRAVWDNPVAWREIRTWAYGRKVVAIRVGYVLLAGLAAAMLWNLGASSPRHLAALVLLPLFLVSLVLINAQAVTSLSTERDGKTLDLLLVTDLTPREFVFGKLGGIFFNTKDMVLAPLLLCCLLWWRGGISAENAFYVMAGLLVMDLFVAVLGVHCGLIHENSRVAVGTSLGTVFFLFVGVAICMRIMVAFSGSFQYQLPAFLALILGGGVGLYVALGARNASTAIFCAAFCCPFLTFWAITSYLQNFTLAVFLVTTATYGFATATMLIPALSEFAVATGRTASGE